MSVAALLALALTGSIGLRGDTTCPTVQQISARVDALLPKDGANLHWVDVRARDGGLHLSLWGPSGVVEAERTIPPAACEALAEASAVAIATWAAQPIVNTSPPPAIQPVLHGPDDDRIFDRAALKEYRARTSGSAEESARPVPRYVVPLSLVITGTLMQFAAAGLFAVALSTERRLSTVRGSGPAWIMTIGAISVLGFGAMAASLFWMLHQVATTPHDAEVSDG
jgi:hypothetical protein